MQHLAASSFSLSGALAALSFGGPALLSSSVHAPRGCVTLEHVGELGGAPGAGPRPARRAAGADLLAGLSLLLERRRVPPFRRRAQVRARLLAQPGARPLRAGDGVVRGPLRHPRVPPGPGRPGRSPSCPCRPGGSPTRWASAAWRRCGPTWAGATASRRISPPSTTPRPAPGSRSAAASASRACICSTGCGRWGRWSASASCSEPGGCCATSTPRARWCGWARRCCSPASRRTPSTT